MTKIGHGAFVHPKAELDDTVVVEPYAHIEEGVVIAAHSKIGRFASIHKNTSIGCNNVVHAFSCLGTPPQIANYDKNYPGKLVIANNNVIHQYVTISHGTHNTDDGTTRVGSNNTVMANAHIGHDCNLADEIVLVNQATLAGHVEVGSHAIIGAFCAVHQFCRIGESAMLTAAAMINKDIMPYIMVARNPSKVFGINKVGLQRRQFTKEDISLIQQAYRVIFRGISLTDNILTELSTLTASSEHIKIMKTFIETSKRGILRK